MNHSPLGLFFVLLILPNTSFTDWQGANAPHLHELMATGSVALMNARTAEKDQITTRAGVYTLAAGARMLATPSTQGLDYPARHDNLTASLRAAGVEVPKDVHPNPSSYALSPGTFPPSSPDPFSHTGEMASSASRNERSPLPSLRERGLGGEGEFLAVNLDGDPAKADEAIGKWEKVVAQRGGELMVVSPNPSPAEYKAEDQLTPVVLWGPKILSGALTSRSTHTPGLVTNTDIAPTIANYFHARLLIPAFGAPMTTQTATDGYAPIFLAQENSVWQAQAREQRTVPYIAALIALVVAGATILAFKTGRDIRPLAVLVVALPLALILSNAALIFLSLAISAVGGAYVMRKRPWVAILWLSSAAALVVVADAVFQAGRSTSQSIIGYSPMEGARYYGLGNEAMGILAGALVILTAALARGKRRWTWTVLIWLVAGIALGWPAAGAKAGGFFVALVALAAFAWTASGQSIKRPMPWLVTIAGFCVLGALFVMAGRFVGHTHIGQAVELAQAQGFAAIRSIASRKEAMDLHLVFHSVWSLVLTCGVGGAVLFYRKKGLGRKEGRVAAATGFAATAACLALNDAGVVAAALCSLYLWAFCVVGADPESLGSAARRAAKDYAKLRASRRPAR